MFCFILTNKPTTHPLVIPYLFHYASSLITNTRVTITIIWHTTGNRYTLSPANEQHCQVAELGMQIKPLKCVTIKKIKINEMTIFVHRNARARSLAR